MTQQATPAKTDPDPKGYNERLFGGRGLRSRLHNARFEWFRRRSRELTSGDINMLEIGCFDGKILDYTPVPPQSYQGFDAGWEGGLASAQARFKQHPNWRFSFAKDHTPLQALPTDAFNLAALMETIEHMPPAAVEPYLIEIERVTRGFIMITVPNEKGLVFLGKWLIKKFVLRSAEKYTASELLFATLGIMDKVERNEHKGFDYVRLKEQLSQHFDIVSVESIPFGVLPTWLSFTVGIVARSRRAQSN